MMFFVIVLLKWLVKKVWWVYSIYKIKFIMIYLKNNLKDIVLWWVWSIICVIFWIVYINIKLKNSLWKLVFLIFKCWFWVIVGIFKVWWIK